jgi:hypothetical protein
MEEDKDYTAMIEQIYKLMEDNNGKIESIAKTEKYSGDTSGHLTYFPNKLSGGSWDYYKDYRDYKDYIWNDTHITSTTSIGPNTVRHQELVTRLEKLEKLVEDRLLVLRPNKEMLEKYELLQSIYEQYKAAEALLYGNEDDDS